MTHFIPVSWNLVPAFASETPNFSSLHVFGYLRYLNLSATTPHKLSP